MTSRARWSPSTNRIEPISGLPRDRIDHADRPAVGARHIGEASVAAYRDGLSPSVLLTGGSQLISWKVPITAHTLAGGALISIDSRTF